MSNQPAQTRPWFRLASISRSPLQEPSPTPEQATVRPTFRPAVPAAAGAVSSVPTSPVGRVSQPSSPADKRTITATAAARTTYPLKTTTSSSLPSYPAKRALTTTSVTSSLTQKPASPVTTTARMSSPKASTTVRSAIHNQIQSPQTKPPIARPHSPLTLSPSQLKAQSEAEQEQKTVLVEKTIDKPNGWLFGTPQKDFGETKEKCRGKKYYSDSNDVGVRTITISGDNHGAFMKVTQSLHKNGVQGGPRSIQKNANSGSEASDDRKMKAKSKIMPTNAFINSNVQGINNSIVYNSSCTEHNPGVHLTLYS